MLVMTDGQNQWNDVCRDAFDRLNEKLDRIDESIRGNGKPGLNNRVSRLESAESSRSRLMWIIIGASIVSAANLLVTLL
jgi:hypothetical protein